MTINGKMNFHQYFIPILQGGSAVEFSFIKKGVAGAYFAPTGFNIYIIKANMFYIDRHLLTKTINKWLWSRFVY